MATETESKTTLRQSSESFVPISTSSLNVCVCFPFANTIQLFHRFTRDSCLNGMFKNRLYARPMVQEFENSKLFLYLHWWTIVFIFSWTIVKEKELRQLSCSLDLWAEGRGRQLQLIRSSVWISLPIDSLIIIEYFCGGLNLWKESIIESRINQRTSRERGWQTTGVI